MSERYQRIPAVFNQLEEGNFVYGKHPEYGDEIVTQMVMTRTHKQIVIKDSHFNNMQILTRDEFDEGGFTMAYNAKREVLENRGCSTIHNHENRYFEAFEKLGRLTEKPCRSWPDCEHISCERYSIVSSAREL